jgi:hypothetical protein
MAHEQINAVLDTLSEREAGVVSMLVGLTDGTPTPVAKIAKVFGVTETRVHQILSKALSELAHQSRSSVLVDYLDNEGLALVVEHTPAELVLCPRHGWVDRPAGPQLRCPCCSCSIAKDTDRGRPRKYCSAACRQAAHRARPVGSG